MLLCFVFNRPTNPNRPTTMKTTPRIFAAAFLAASSLASAQNEAPAPAPAAVAPATPAPKAKPLAEPEKKFVKDAAEGHLIEQKLTGLAKKSASSEGAKKVGAKIAADHAKSWEEFATVSMAKGAQLSMELKASDKSGAERMGKLEGEKFDKEFLKDIGKEAKKLARVFETGSKSMKDPELKAFAEKWVPTLKSHADDVEKAEKELKGAK